MKIKKQINSKTLFYLFTGIVIFEIAVAIVSIFISHDAASKDNALSNILFGVLSIFMFSLPFLIESKWQVGVPNYLKTIVLIFLFLGIVGGYMHGFVTSVKGYDKMMHTISGILISIIGFEIAHVTISAKIDKAYVPAGIIGIFAFSFSVTLLVLWEFYEFLVDTVAFQLDATTTRNMQRYQWIYQGHIFPQGYGLIDTMLDLVVGVCGAALVSIIGWRILLKKQKKDSKK